MVTIIGITSSICLLIALGFCAVVTILAATGTVILIGSIWKKFGPRLMKAMRFGMKAMNKLGATGQNQDGDGGIREQLLIAQIEQMGTMNERMVCFPSQFSSHQE